MSVFLEKRLLIVPMQSQNMGACTMPLQSALVFFFCSNRKRYQNMSEFLQLYLYKKEDGRRPRAIGIATDSYTVTEQRRQVAANLS